MRLLLLLCLSLTITILAQDEKAEPKTSRQTNTCIGCHEMSTPGIVEDWKRSRHAQTTLNQALGKEEIERRVSVKELPEGIDGDIVVGCYECHSLNPEAHTDNFEHMGNAVNVIVSPNDCQTCHPEEAEQYSGSKKAHAVDNLRKNPVFDLLVNTSLATFHPDKNFETTVLPELNDVTCYACHGTEVKVIGTKTVSSSLGEIEVPELSNWPNMGVGRINPDGSQGSCTACHPRHSFDIKVARQPYTCGQCHLQPDVPGFDVYKESKHGNMFSTLKEEWDFDAVPWRLGTDFNAPSCATCHNSLVTTPDGDVVMERTHDFGSRMWVRIFSLIYSTPQPVSGKTYEITNKDGMPLPVAFDGTPASEFLISEEEQQQRREAMEGLCRNCHSTSWAEQYFTRFHKIVEETDKMTAASTALVAEAWEKGLADQENPFNEDIEFLWVKSWLFYANSVKYGAAMSGPDYSTFKNGWYEMVHNIEKMKKAVKTAE